MMLFPGLDAEAIPVLCQSLRDQFDSVAVTSSPSVLCLPCDLYQFLSGYIVPGSDLSDLSDPSLGRQDLVLNLEYLRALFLGLSDLRLECHLRSRAGPARGSQLLARPVDLSPFRRLTRLDLIRVPLRQVSI